MIVLELLYFLHIVHNVSYHLSLSAFGSFSIQSADTWVCCMQIAPLVGNSGECASQWVVSQAGGRQLTAGCADWRQDLNDLSSLTLVDFIYQGSFCSEHS